MYGLKYLFLVLSCSLFLNAESYFSLKGVKSFDTTVSVEADEFKIYKDEILREMKSKSRDLGIELRSDTSSVLNMVVSKFALDDTVGVRITLELLEYLHRAKSNEDTLVVSYQASQVFPYNKSELEDDLFDTTEALLESFGTEFKRTVQKSFFKSNQVTHQTFPDVMKYETDYKKALIKAKKESKKLMLLMTTEYCPWCRKLEERFLNQERIDSLIKKYYVPVRLNLKTKAFPKQLASTPITPTMYILNAQTEEVEGTFLGYSSQDRFLNHLKNVDKPDKEKKVKVQIFDTHVHTEDNYYHFDVVVVDKTQEEVEAYAKAYLKQIGVDFAKISQNRCLFCHEEIADEKMIKAIEEQGYYIIPMQGCPK